MINGAHLIVYSKNPAADRAFFQDVLGLGHVDAGDGWLIFGLPPSEVAVHPAKKNGVHELYLMCEDVDVFVKAMKKQKLACDAVTNQGWGLLTSVTLPGGGKLGVYEPRHARPGVEAKSVGRRLARAAKPAPSRKASAASKTSTAGKKRNGKPGSARGTRRAEAAASRRR
jgi:hypothetical protein